MQPFSGIDRRGRVAIADFATVQDELSSPRPRQERELKADDVIEDDSVWFLLHGGTVAAVANRDSNRPAAVPYPVFQHVND